MDAALDQLDREHKSLTSEAAMPELPDPSLAWEDLSAEDRRALTEMLVDKIIYHDLGEGRIQDEREERSISRRSGKSRRRWTRLLISWTGSTRV